MPKGAIHFTGSNFAIRRRLRWDILDRMRKLIENGTYKRPRWMDWVERYPPLETRNLLHTEKVIKNVYLPLINSLLKKYPHLRFEGCFNSENEWQKGFDNYTFDHPVMQFVSYQLSLMNKGISKEEAFLRAEKVFYKNRIESEKKQRVSMAFGLDEEESLSYTAGSAYLAEKEAKDKVKFLTEIRDELRKLKEGVLGDKRQKSGD
ncbi:hypothetical protein TpMuguga_03g00585 [Theileria parva strain Muguga]|uniref:uncharacterized protein n=1 Tax=Theileria parva strain Muguga TaxID=333668 RepID=UPI001C61F6B9|nr:uncharacterized protein TpMuguga_03g00585 [Theileria parva strain Muguga]EAN31330.2 hypothetical protein TpMuguga_03g00585 [Theileria parva strain Muguga]